MADCLFGILTRSTVQQRRAHGNGLARLNDRRDSPNIKWRLGYSVHMSWFHVETRLEGRDACEEALDTRPIIRLHKATPPVISSLLILNAARYIRPMSRNSNESRQSALARLISFPLFMEKVYCYPRINIAHFTFEISRTCVSAQHTVHAHAHSCHVSCPGPEHVVLSTLKRNGA
jgi:hypothetical protein